MPPTTDPYVQRIQALLAKAESTSFPEEAEALVAKAQELMARHAIDQAMVEADATATPVTSTSLVVEAPYASAKASLLGTVARANRCRVVEANGPRGSRLCTLVGHEADLESVQALFSSLSIQAVRFMLQAQVPPHDGVRRFRHAFLLAYAVRIGERLRQAERLAEAEAEAARASGGGSGPAVSVVLAERSAEVDAELRRLFPSLRTRSVSVSSHAGYTSGRRAADRASLGGSGVGTGASGALGAG